MKRSSSAMLMPTCSLLLAALPASAHRVEFSRFAPYPGIGWGHQSTKLGFGFIGVSYNF